MRKKFPSVTVLFFAVFLISLVCFGVAWLSPTVADFLNRTAGHAVRRGLAALTSWIPFSLIEVLLFLIPLWITLLIVWIVRSVRRPWKRQRWFAFLLCFCMTLSFLYIFTMGIAYHTEKLEKKLGMTDSPVSKEELHRTALLCKEKTEELLDSVTFENGESVLPYDLSALSEKIVRAYDAFLAEYPIFSSFESRGKPVVASELMSYAQILGVYSCLTGESNLNMCFPDYCLPFTVAHEFAHQRGIARENEANFIAFLVCIRSDDDYIRYSGYMNMYEYLWSALYRADPGTCKEMLAATDPRIRTENAAYSRTYKKYQGTVIGSVSTGINDAYLQWNGTEGSVSYGLVVDLAVAYYRDRNG